MGMWETGPWGGRWRRLCSWYFIQKFNGYCPRGWTGCGLTLFFFFFFSFFGFSASTDPGSSREDISLLVSPLFSLFCFSFSIILASKFAFAVSLLYKDRKKQSEMRSIGLRKSFMSSQILENLISIFQLVELIPHFMLVLEQNWLLGDYFLC